MKSNTLQLRRALSTALFVLLLSVAGTKNALAQNQVATLQHNDTITAVFYGQNALVSAHSAAVAGDIITLSSGTFNNSNITKSIIIHGAGCVYDSITQVMPTIISGDFQLRSNNISFEGIQFTGSISFPPYQFETANGVHFTKCHIANLVNNGNQGNDKCYDYCFHNCILNNFSLRNYYNAQIINSVVRFTRYTHTDIYNPTNIYNSVVLFDNGWPINNLIAYNSIIATVSGHEVSNCTFFNCIGIETGETLLFDGQTVQNVMEVNSYEDVFETFTGEVTNDNIYQLKEDIATTFLGNDGTEVGIYGGMMPYRTRPNYMIIKNCNVAGRTTEDNKLGVEMELLNAGE